jgi:hypothetical protein
VRLPEGIRWIEKKIKLRHPVSNPRPSGLYHNPSTRYSTLCRHGGTLAAGTLQRHLLCAVSCDRSNDRRLSSSPNFSSSSMSTGRMGTNCVKYLATSPRSVLAGPYDSPDLRHAYSVECSLKCHLYICTIQERQAWRDSPPHPATRTSPHSSRLLHQTRQMGP